MRDAHCRRPSRPESTLLRAALAALSLAAGGCAEMKAWWDGQTRQPPPAARELPPAVRRLLPVELKIHFFTKERVFDPAGGIRGIEAHVQLLDAAGDTTKAYGRFRFELYRHDPHRPRDRGALLAVWTEDLAAPEANQQHWDDFHRTYQFNLRWDKAIPVGEPCRLVAVYQSPYTERLFAETLLPAGEGRL